jgi:hypothetical protein
MLLPITLKRQDFLPKIFWAKTAFYGLDTELEPEPEPVTCQKSEPEPEP